MLKNLTNNDIQQILDYFYKQKHENSFEFTLGNTTDILISAPHAVNQTRNEKEKFAEPYTAVIAKLLNKYYGYSIICKTKNIGDDANYDETSSYKDFLLKYCQKYKPILVIDLHGLAKNRDCTINLCTDFGKTLQDDTEMLGEVIEALKT